jgi:hypothetical protein
MEIIFEKLVYDEENEGFKYVKCQENEAEFVHIHYDDKPCLRIEKKNFNPSDYS